MENLAGMSEPQVRDRRDPITEYLFTLLTHSAMKPTPRNWMN